MDENTKKLVEAWDNLDEQCPDCGGMESACDEIGCQSSSWTDADTRKYREGVKNARNRNRS